MLQRLEEYCKMKKLVALLSFISFISLSSAAYALLAGLNPPEDYIKKLKTCTRSVTTNSSIAYETYAIKGLLPDGRCEVQFERYTNFANNKVYNGYKTLYSSYSKNGKVPTQAEMIEQSKRDKDVMICKFTPAQRLALYDAYYKSPQVGNGSSPFDKLMNSYFAGTCQ